MNFKLKVIHKTISLENISLGGNALYKLISIDEHIFVQVLVALFLVEFELEFVGIHRILIKSFERCTEISIDIRFLVPVLGCDTCKLIVLGLFSL